MNLRKALFSVAAISLGVGLIFAMVMGGITWNTLSNSPGLDTDVTVGGAAFGGFEMGASIGGFFALVGILKTILGNRNKTPEGERF